MPLSDLAHIFFPRLDTVNAIEFDTVTSETHDAEVEVTEHPVEQGADISDHARVKAVTLTLDAMVSNTPIPDYLRTENGKPKEFPWQAPGRAQDIYMQLRDLKDVRQLVSVSTQRGTYTNMVITKLSVPVTADTGEALRFTISFKQVRVVSTSTVKITNVAQKVKTGKQAATPTEEPRAKSLGARLDDLRREKQGLPPISAP